MRRLFHNQPSKYFAVPHLCLETGFYQPPGPLPAPCAPVLVCLGAPMEVLFREVLLYPTLRSFPALKLLPRPSLHLVEKHVSG